MSSPITALADAYNAHLRTAHPDYVLWERSKFKYGVLIGVVVALAVSIPSFYLGIYVFHLPSSAGRPFAFIPLIAFIMPIVLINRRGAKHFARQWRDMHPGLPVQAIGQTQSYGQLPNTTQDDNDELLQIASQITSQLGISNYTPRSVLWQNMYPIGNSYNNVPSDQCVIRGETLYFAENMKGRLTPEDWRPIIASSLVYNRKIHDRMLTDLLLRLLPILVVYFLGWFLIPPLFPVVYYYNPDGSVASYNNVGWEIMIFAGFGLVFALVPVGLYWLRGLKLKADREAAKTIGIVQFIESLTKIGQASPSDIPSITRRINNLQRAL